MESFSNSFDSNFNSVRTELLRRLEDIVTDPNDDRGIPTSAYALLSKTGKTQWSIPLDQLVDTIAQDLHINPHQLQAIREELFYQ